MTTRADDPKDDCAMNQGAGAGAEIRDGATELGPGWLSDFIPLTLTGEEPATNIQNEIGRGSKEARAGSHSRWIAARSGCSPPAITLYGMVGCTHPPLSRCFLGHLNRIRKDEGSWKDSSSFRPYFLALCGILGRRDCWNG